MECPRCAATLVGMDNKSIHLDVCFKGCGGLWFDAHEFKKMDEKHEASPDFLEQLSRSAKKTLPLNEKMNCPKCTSIPMLRRFSSVLRNVAIDECPSCAGIWLDAGELTAIHSEFKTEQERAKATDAYINENFGATMANEKLEGQIALEKTKKVAKALRFICPSYYIPGKQKGGAF